MDPDDCEDFLVEEGIGHYDLSGNFQYGPAPLGWTEDGDLDREMIEGVPVVFPNSNVPGQQEERGVGEKSGEGMPSSPGLASAAESRRREVVWMLVRIAKPALVTIATAVFASWLGNWLQDLMVRGAASGLGSNFGTTEQRSAWGRILQTRRQYPS